MSEPPPDKKDTGTGSTDRTDSHKSVRSVVVGAASLALLAVGVIGLVAFGPFGLLAAPAVAAGGGVVAARVRNPRQRGTRPGLLSTLAARPRRTRTVSTSTKTWPLTGSQSKRARSKGAAGGSSGGRRGGLRMPSLPALTKRGKSKRAAAHLGSHAPARRTAAPRAAARPGARTGMRPGGKPAGTRAPSTPSRTPARAGSARKLAVAPGSTGRARKRPSSGAVRGVTGPGGLGTARRSSRGSGGSQRRRAGSATVPRGPRLKAGVRPSTGSRPVRRNHRLTTPGVTKPVKKSRPSSHRPATGATPRVRRNRPISRPGARPTTAGTRRRATLGGKGATRRARRMATPKFNRVDHRTPTVPNRTKAKPRPRVKTPTRKLIRTAMRVPTRHGFKLKRPTKLQTRVARRHLRRRARVLAGRGLVATLKAPWLAVRASYRHRPLWAWPTAPGPVNPEWRRPTETAKLRPQRDPRPKPPDDVPVPPSDPPTIKRRHRTPYPKTHARRAPAGTQPTTTTGGTITMAPTDQLADAFSAIANYTPQTPEELEQFLAANAEMVQQFGAAFQTLASRMRSEMPLAAPVADGTAELGAALAACHGIAGQVHSTYAAAHQVEKDRRENPRPNEGFWDVGNR